MNWQKEAIDDLKNYNRRKAAIHNLNERIKLLEEQAIKPRGGSVVPMRGGCSKQEDTLINNIAERAKLQTALATARLIVEQVDRGLAALDDRQRRILEVAFIDRPLNYVDKLCDELGYEVTHIYRLRSEALRNFTLNCYGVVEI